MKLIEPGDKKLFALIYGMSGSGKTHLAATYAQMYKDEPVILIDADQGSATLQAQELQKDTDNLFVLSMDSFKDLDEAFNCCKINTVENWIRVVPELKGILKLPIRCIVWDTWTECQWMFSSELRAKNGLAGKGLNYRSNIQLQHWGQLTDLNKLSVASFKDLPIDCLFLMQAQIKEDSTTGQIIKGPAIHGKLVTELPAMFTTVIYTYNAPNGDPCATTLPKLGWIAKVRGIVGKDIKFPTMKELLK